MNKTIYLSLFLLSLSSCYFGASVNSVSLSLFNSLPSVGDSSAPSNSSYFYIDLDVNKYETANEFVPLYEISTTDDFGSSESRNSPSNCEIPLILPENENDITKLSSETIICILDILEYDIVVKDLHILYNFPAGMCDYVRVGLPWHFNHPIIPGPFVVEREVGKGDDAETRYCDRADDSDSGDSCREEEEEVCQGETKCCYGGAKTDGSRWEPEQECFGGPSLIAQLNGHSNEEFYTSLLEEASELGTQKTISLSDVLSINGAESIGGVSVSSTHSNYYTELDHSPEDLKQVSRSSDLPAFLKANSNYPYTPRLFFEFQCLDSAGEVLHEILFMLREWNTFEEFIDFYDAGGNDKADPDVEGDEGDECKYENRSLLDGETSPCNDLLDFDDIADCDDDKYPAWCSIFSQGTADNYPRIKYSEEESTDE